MQSVTLAARADLDIFNAAIKECVGESRYELWFSGNTTIEIEDGIVDIGVPNRFFKEWLESHFEEPIRKAARRAYGKGLAVKFRIDPKLFAKLREQNPPAALAADLLTPVAPLPVRGHSNKSAPAARGKRPVDLPLFDQGNARPPSRPSKFALNRYVIGPSNRVAHAASMALVEDPKRQGLSPLVVHGAIGHGKTHLLRGVEDALRQKHPEARVQYFACEEFTNQFLEAMKNNALTSFRKKIRALDVLVVDDIQFLGKKKATQEEFFHTMNALSQRGGKVMVSCDLHPRKIAALGEEIKSRLVQGMVAKIDPPTREMRKQIAMEKAAQRGMELCFEVADLLAENLCTTVTELEGALNYLEHYSQTLDAPLDLATAKLALAEILRCSVPVVRIEDVVKRACELFGISPKQLRDRSRIRSVSHPRMLVLYLTRKYAQAPYIEIGQAIGGLNHSTVIAAERRIVAMIEADASLQIGARIWNVRDAVETFERELGRA